MKRLVVNQNDEIIGAKTRSELDLAKDIYRISSLWLTNSQGEVLIAQRGFKLNNSPGLYGPAVAGTVEENETYENNVYKEAEEEIGLTGIPFTKGPKFRRDGNRNYFCQFFTATVNMKLEEFTLDDYEVEKIMWISFEDLKKDVETHPEKYVKSMNRVIEMFAKKQT